MGRRFDLFAGGGRFLRPRQPFHRFHQPLDIRCEPLVDVIAGKPLAVVVQGIGEAVARTIGLKEGEFLNRYNAKRKDAVLRTIDASPVGAALLAFVDDNCGGFEGTLTDLLQRLERYRQPGEAWPRSAKGLGDALRRLSPALRTIGFECKSQPKAGGIIRWTLRRQSQATALIGRPWAN